MRAGYGISESAITRGIYERNTTDVTGAVQVFLKWLGDGQRPKVNGQISAAIVMVREKGDWKIDVLRTLSAQPRS